MSDPEVAVEPTFAEYARAENAKERAAETGLTVEVSAPDSVPAPAVGAEPAGEPAVASETSAETPAVEAKADDERNPDGTFKPKSKKVSNTGEWARNARLTAELRAAQEELTRLKTAPSPSQPVAPAAPQVLDPSDPEPTIDQFLDKPDPYAALAVAAGKWAVREERREAQKQTYEAQRREAQGQTAEREQTFAAQHPDYHDVVPTVIEILKAQPAVLTAMADDDLGPAVAYHLAQHPDEARRIAALTPVQGVMAIGKLLSRMTPAPSGSGTPAVSTSKAKPLIKPVSGAPVAPESSPPDPDKTSFSDWVRINNAADRRRAREMSGA